MEKKLTVSRLIHPEDEMFLFFINMGHSHDTSITLYMNSGQQMLREFLSIINSVSFELSSKTKILEFACGYGRFTRHLLSIIDASQITVADIYTDAVDFQKSNFGVSGFYSYDKPEKILIQEKYDIIFVGSLFSHLPRTLWELILHKLYSSLSQDGILIFSVHGSSCLYGDKTIPESGFLYVENSESKSLSSEIYGTTYVTSDFVNKTVYKLTKRPVTLFCKKGLYNYQDIYVVKNSTTKRESILHSIDLIKDQYIHGWALFSTNPDFKLFVEIYSNDVLIACGDANEYREDLKRHSIGDGCCSFNLKINSYINFDLPLKIKILGFDFEIPSCTLIDKLR